MKTLLKVEQCGIQFGGLKALEGLDFELKEGELLGVIGPNGAGKTTFFNLLTGVYPPSSGRLFFKEQLVTALKPHQINQAGISRTFQNIRLFLNLSVIDNVCVAFYQHIKYSLWDVIWQRKKYVEEEKQLKAKALELLTRFDLHKQKDELAKNLPYGDQRRLEMVRALATQPKLLLLDEPAAGMNPTEKKALIELIRHLHQELKLAIILIEHDMSVVMELCPRIIVLDYGVVIAEGEPDYIRQHPVVIEAYLGEKKDVKSM